MADEGKTLKRDLDVAKGLVEQYQRNASAVSVTFSVATEANWVHSDAELRDAIAAVRKELWDIHRFQICQTLSGGRLRVPIEESTDPAMDLLGLWAGGYPNPATLERWGQSFDDFRRKIQPRFMALPVRDVVISGAVKDQKKLVLPRVIRAFLEQLPRCQGPSAGLSDLPTEGDFVGLVMDGAARTRTAFLLPRNPGHILASGTTRVGKTCTARVIVENFLLRKVKVIIIDPTRQWCGISRPTGDEMMLQRLEHFGIGRKNASGFPVRLFVPALGIELPSNPEELTGQSLVVSLKGLGDTERCRNAAHVLNAVNDCMMAESNQVILVVGIEEAHSFLPGNVVGNEAEEAAKEVRTLLTRIAREKLKYGVCLLLVSQSLADFHREARIVREMVNTRIFMRLKDPTETALVERYVSREAAEIVKNLRVGEASCTAPWSRPPRC
ncbi:MAG: DUF853 family protein [Candidatus Hydrogenedentes bacterium]|nr:DUF853 family protein [Candidatus Hydrogenedentota bacterium]